MIHPSYGIIIPNSLSHLKAGKTRTFLILITLCKDADLDARAWDFYLFYMHKNKGSLDGEEFNFAKVEKLEILNIKIIQVSSKYTSQCFKISFITERRFMLERMNLAFPELRKDFTHMSWLEPYIFLKECASIIMENKCSDLDTQEGLPSNEKVLLFILISSLMVVHASTHLREPCRQKQSRIKQNKLAVIPT